MRLIILFLTIGVCSVLNAQIISQDTNVCGSFQGNLYALSADTTSLYTDDDYSEVVDIGFPFVFYGGTYDKFVVNDNGYISFDTTLAFTPSGYVISAPLPSTAGINPYNAIMVTCQDLLLFDPFFPAGGGHGKVYVTSTGIAPNRKCLITWCEAAMFSCTSDYFTAQIVLHEGSNKIEMFIKDKTICPWNNGAGVQGLIDVTSTNFDIVIDPPTGSPRNYPLQWTATNEGWEFVASGPSSYTINQIAYAPITAGINSWYDDLGNLLGIGPVLPVNISNTTTIHSAISGDCYSAITTDSITITVTGCFTINLSSTDASCYGNDATITVAPTLATTTPPWDIDLLDMSGAVVQSVASINTNTHTFTNLFPGTYVIKVTEVSGYSSQDTITTIQLGNPLSIHSNFQHVNCYNGSDGYIGVSVQNGALPYQFYLNGVLNTNAIPYDSLFTDLVEGTYIISVVDQNNCMIRDTVELTSPNFPLQVHGTTKAVVCHGSNNGEAIAVGAGGTPLYSYEWYNMMDLVNPIGIDSVQTGLTAGSYMVVLEDANGCDTFSTIQIVESLTPLVGTPQTFLVSCKGDSSGMIVVDAGGGFAPYTYLWTDSNGDTLQLVSNIYTRDSLQHLPAGVYELDIIDAMGCEEHITFNIVEPPVALEIDDVLVVDSVLCNGDSDGRAWVYVSGGMPTYSYLWDNGETNYLATSLTGGWHSVTVSDTWGCEVTDDVYIPETDLIESTLSLDSTVSCYGGGDGVLSVTTVGGLSPYDYFWSHLPNTGPTTVNGLSHGSYYLTTRDALGCVVVDSIYMPEPNPLFVAAQELVRVRCYGEASGLANAYANGGNMPYTFDWLTGGQQGDTINTLVAGLDTVIVTDAKGCTAMDTVRIHQPDLLEVSIDSSLIVYAYCVGVNTASLTAVSVGGTSPYTYEWNDNPIAPQTTQTAIDLFAGIYTITVTDARGCIASFTQDIDTVTSSMNLSLFSLNDYNGYGVSCFGSSDGSVGVTANSFGPYTYQWVGPSFTSSNDTITSLVAGSYSVTVTDGNNCVENQLIQVTEPLPMDYTVLGSTNTTCLGSCDGTILVQINGGALPYTGIATDNHGVVSPISAPAIGDSIIPEMCTGNYTITIKDANGCLASLMSGGNDQATLDTTIVTSAIIVPTAPVVFCNGGATAVLHVGSPNPDTLLYTYTWEDHLGQTLSLDTHLTGINAGVYTLYAHYMDTSGGVSMAYSGCSSSDMFTVTELDAIEMTAVITDVDCFGNSTGSISTAVTGGTPSYTYQWVPSQTGASITNLAAGTYTVSVTDDNNCQGVDTFEVTQPDLLTVTMNQNGYTLDALVSGGTAVYTYSWREQSNPGVHLQGGATYIASTEGTYYVEVTDNHGCEVTSNTIVIDGGLTSLEEGNTNMLSIYPNPFSHETTIDFGKEIDKAQLRLFNVLGELIKTYDIQSVDKFTLDRNKEMTAGVYFIEILENSADGSIFKLIVD